MEYMINNMQTIISYILITTAIILLGMLCLIIDQINMVEKLNKSIIKKKKK